VHKPVGGKSGEPALQQARNLWLVNLQNAGGASLGKTPGANRLCDTKGEIGFCEPLFWFRQTNIGENAAAAFLYGNVSIHWLSSPAMFETPGVFLRGLIKTPI
jgi:hypothetical protein